MRNLYNRIRGIIAGGIAWSKEKVLIAFYVFSKRERAVFLILVLIFAISILGILQTINTRFMVSVPMHGGSVTEGIVGTPRFSNPILATTSVDEDIVALVYSGLMRRDAAGNLIPDLAESYEMSGDGKTYTFTLKDGVYFHDGEPVTARDVVFTVETLQNAVVQSSHKASWDGVSVSEVNERTIAFSLRQPYASFLESTTLGILPAHLWSNTPIELNTLNTEPVGSGPYKIEHVQKASSGTINSYELSSFDEFALGEPYIENITLRFYPSESELVKAFQDGDVEEISSVSPASAARLAEQGYRVQSTPLPRVFGLFFNQNVNQLFLDKAVVRAVNQAIDKERIISEVLLGHGVAIKGPIPPSLRGTENTGNGEEKPSREEIIRSVQEGLTKAGWTKNAEGFFEKTTTTKGKKTTVPLSFSISTGNAPELTATASLIKEDLAQVGIRVDVKTFEAGSLNEEVIRPRQYDTLLFGEIINTESDLFAFWHSSQRNDPGLNVAMYTNARADKLLEDAFVTVDPETRVSKYAQFEAEIQKDIPAVFLYAPNFVYAIRDTLSGQMIDSVRFPKDRFASVHTWHAEEYKVWKIFAR